MGRISDELSGQQPVADEEDVDLPIAGPSNEELQQEPEDLAANSALLRMFRPVVAAASGLLNALPGGTWLENQMTDTSKGMEFDVKNLTFEPTKASPFEAQRTAAIRRYIRGRDDDSAVNTVARFIGDFYGMTTTAGIGAKAVAPFTKAAGPAASFLQRYAARLPYVAAEGTALQATSMMRNAVKGSDGKWYEDIPFNYVLPAVAEGIVTKLSKTHGRLSKEMPVTKTVNYADDPFELAQKAEIATDMPVDYPSVEQYAIKSQVAHTYTEPTALELIKENWDNVKEDVTKGSKVLAQKMQREGTRLSTSTIMESTPVENRAAISQIGKSIFALALKARENADIIIAAGKSDLAKLRPEWMLKNGEMDAPALMNVRALVEGGIPASDARTARMIGLWAKIRSGLAEDIENTGMKVYDTVTKKWVDFAERANYWPNYHNFVELRRMIEADPDNPATQELIKKLRNVISQDSGWTGKQDTDSILRWLGDKQRQARAKSLLVRHDLPGGSYDPFEVIPRYLEDVVRPLEFHRFLGQTIAVEDIPKYFGEWGEKLLPGLTQQASISSLIPDGTKRISIRNIARNAIEQLGGNTIEFDRALDNIMGITEHTPAGKMSTLLRGANTAMWLANSALSQAHGISNIVTDTSLSQTARATIEAMTKEGREFGQRTAAMSHDLATILDSSEALPSVGRFLRKVGATKVDHAVRTIAAIAAKNTVTDIVEKVAQRGVESMSRNERAFIERMGVDLGSMVERWKNVKDIDPEQLIRIGYRGHVSNQFLADVIDMPEFAGTEWGRVFFQMRSFAYQQAIFWKERVVDEAVHHRNFAPLARMLTGGAAVGEAVLDLKDLARMRDPVDRGRQSVVLGRSIGDPLRNMGIDIEPGSTGEWLANRYIDNILLAGGLGMWMDTVDAIDETKTPRVLLGPSYGTIQIGMDTATSALAGVRDYFVKSMNEALPTTDPSQPLLPKVMKVGTGVAAMVGVPGSAALMAALPAAGIVAPFAMSKFKRTSSIAAALEPTDNAIDRTLPQLQSPEQKLMVSVRRANKEKTQTDRRINAALGAGSIDRAVQLAQTYNKWLDNNHSSTIIDRAIDAGHQPGDAWRTLKALTISNDDLRARARGIMLKADKERRIKERQASFGM